MNAFRVAGGSVLRGTVRVEGSKNAALPVLAATLAIPGRMRLEQIPAVDDVSTMQHLLRWMGTVVEHAPDGSLTVDSTNVFRSEAPYELVQRMRAGICVLGPLLARFGRARVAMPGGCRIGNRPVDLHLRGLAALGADLRLQAGEIIAEARQLRGAGISLSGPAGSTVTGTCNVMTAATLARGRSVLRGAAKEPEVIELGRFLNAAGAQISGLGTETLEIDGVDELRPVAHRVTTDRVEAATFAVAALITGGDITIRNAPVEHMTAVIQALRDIGGDADDTAFGLRIRRTGELRCVRLRAEPHPGIPTDVQSQLTALLATVPGESHVIDQVFPQRFQHVPELNRLGASIRVNGNGAAIQGVSSLSGAPVQASDLRAGAALVLAALAAEGESIIHGADHIDRGYSAFDRKLRALGAAIERLAGPSAAEPLAPWVPAPHFAGGSEADSLELNYGFRAYGADPA